MNIDRALTDPSLRLLPAAAADLLRAHRAPPRLAAHLRAVHDVAVQLADWLAGLGFAHLHFHIVPRPADLPAEHRGPAVFHYLATGSPLSDDRRDEIALAVRAALG